MHRAMCNGGVLPEVSPPIVYPPIQSSILNKNDVRYVPIKQEPGVIIKQELDEYWPEPVRPGTETRENIYNPTPKAVPVCMFYSLTHSEFSFCNELFSINTLDLHDEILIVVS